MIKIKGVNGNLVFIFGPGTCTEYLTYLSSHLAENNAVFAGSTVYFRGEGLNDLSHQEIAALQKLCLENGLILNNNEPPKTVTRTIREKSSPEPVRGQDVFVSRHVRSGQKVHAEGCLVIWGDVNESAEITAGGDIIVLGKLAGVAHAGCYGRKESIVFALNLSPSQIRIADKISRSSGDDSKNTNPEIAYLEEDIICISEYSTRKSNLFKSRS